MLENLQNFDSKWYAVYTRSRHEKKVAESLSQKNLNVFLPLRTVSRRWKDRRKEIDIPLFTSYVFVRIPLSCRLSVLQTSGVVNLVSDQMGPIPIPDQQILAIQKMLASGIKYDPYPYITDGVSVNIIRGPLAGVEGKLIGRRKKHLLILSVDLIQQAAALQIDITDTDLFK